MNGQSNVYIAAMRALLRPKYENIEDVFIKGSLSARKDRSCTRIECTVTMEKDKVNQAVLCCVVLLSPTDRQNRLNSSLTRGIYELTLARFSSSIVALSGNGFFSVVSACFNLLLSKSPMSCRVLS